MVDPPGMNKRKVEDHFSQYNVEKINLHHGTKLQFTLGIKTLILEDVFYHDGQEVARRRR
jgi:hypothetical protein